MPAKVTSTPVGINACLVRGPLAACQLLVVEPSDCDQTPPPPVICPFQKAAVNADLLVAVTVTAVSVPAFRPLTVKLVLL